jgi:tetratricopeptide (TPR) repeat protein
MQIGSMIVVRFDMPIIVAEQVKRLYIYHDFNEYPYTTQFLIGASELGKKYEHMCVKGTKVNVYVSRVFNEEFKVAMEPRIFSSLTVIYAQKESDRTHQQAEGYYLNIDDLANQLSIPDGYYAEVLFMSIVNKEFGEKVIFPNETRVCASKELEGKVNERIDTLRNISAISQSHSFLAELGLADIAKELSLGYSRFEIGDYDGAIKSYRKVVEGFRNHLEEKETKEGKKAFKRLIDNSENRTEKIADFLNKAYSLLSNFGEHYGTHAFEEEGVFSHKLVENLTEYLTKKLRNK